MRSYVRSARPIGLTEALSWSHLCDWINTPWQGYNDDCCYNVYDYEEYLDCSHVVIERNCSTLLPSKLNLFYRQRIISCCGALAREPANYTRGDRMQDETGFVHGSKSGLGATARARLDQKCASIP